MVLHECGPEAELTVEEWVSLYAGYCPRPGRWPRRLSCRLSGGQRRRLDVALALIGDPGAGVRAGDHRLRPDRGRVLQRGRDGRPHPRDGHLQWHNPRRRRGCFPSPSGSGRFDLAGAITGTGRIAALGYGLSNAATSPDGSRTG
jgi:hypothetical protein